MAIEEPRQVGDGAPGGRMRYFSTIDLATSMPSLHSSPTMRGEPHVELAREIRRKRSRRSLVSVQEVLELYESLVIQYVVSRF